MQDPVVTRYAQALFNLAKRRGELPRVQADVERLAQTPQALAVAFDARVAAGVRRERVRSLLRGQSELFRDFVELLFDKRREEVLRGLPQAFHRRVLVDAGGAEGVVESAEPLDAAELERIASALGARLGKRVALENRVLPELIGGVRVVVENRMIDLSLSGRLEGLRKRLLEAPLPSAGAA